LLLKIHLINNKSSIINLKTEIIPSQNEEKIRKNYFSNGGFEEIYIDKNTKTKNDSYLI